MKKIVSIILLILFTANTGLCAGELIIGTDGTISYVDNVATKTIPDNVNLSVDPTKIKTEATVIRSDDKNFKQASGKNKSTLENKTFFKSENEKIKLNVKDIDENDKLLMKYHKKFQKYWHDNAAYLSTSLAKGYEHYNYPEKDNFSQNNPNVLRFELQDGDYAVLKTNVNGCKKYKYAAEYHKDGSLFGIVRIATIYKTRKSKIIQCTEYRNVGRESYHVKHTMVFNIEKVGKQFNFVQFIYLTEFSQTPILVCAQINNDLYLNDESKNLIIRMKKFDIPKEENVVISTINDLIGSVLLAPIAPPLLLVLFLGIWFIEKT